MFSSILTIFLSTFAIAAPTKFKAIEIDQRPSLAINNAGKIEIFGYSSGWDFSRHKDVAAMQIIKLHSDLCYLKQEGSIDCLYKDKAALPKGLPVLKQIVGAKFYVCGLDTSQFAHCWSYYDSSAMDVPNVKFSHLSDTSGEIPCGTTEDGKYVCWGFDYYEYGSGGVTLKNITEQLADNFSISEITILRSFFGENSACALNSQGKLKCIGEYADLAPKNIQFKRIKAEFESVCGITLDDKLFCWGKPDYLNFEDLGNEKIKSFTRDFDSICIVNETDQVKCAGPNMGYMGDVRIYQNGSFLFENGQLFGRNRYDSSNFYDLAKKGKQIRLFSSNGFNTCVLYNDNEFMCDTSLYYSGLVLSKNIESIKVLKEGVCFTTLTKEVFCAKGFEPNVESEFISNGQVDSIEIGTNYQCKTTLDQNLTCTGDISNIPANVGLVTKIIGGDSEVCALNTKNELHCWGTGTLNIPAFSKDIKDFAFNNGAMCALLTSGKFKCWNDNSSAPFFETPENLTATVTEISMGTYQSPYGGKFPSVFLKTIKGDYHNYWYFEYGGYNYFRQLR